MAKWVHIVLGLAALALIVLVGYRLAASKVETDIYRDRLAGLSTEYESLRGMYNTAVRKTAVTELVVKGGKLSLAIRTIEGVHRTIETPYDPAQDIHCDYVLLDGRLWVRRVYDAQTPPEKGLLIDNNLEHVDWNAPGARYGVTVYRPLGREDGRWVVTVTGDGSLGLAKVDEKTDIILSGPPPVRDYEEMQKQIRNSLSDVTIGDVFKRMVSP